MSKTALVHCNDPNRQQFSLVVLGSVARFAAIEPSMARLFGKPGEDIHATIRIVPEEHYPFKIIGPVQQETKNIRYTVSRLDRPKGDGYLVTVKNIREQKGRYFEQIVLKTDSPVKPEIKISVHGYLSE